MLNKFLHLLRSPSENDAVTPQEVNLAAAVLILDIAKSDFEWKKEEKQLFIELLQSEFALNRDQALELKKLAEVHHDQTASIHEFIQQINRAYQQEDKVRLVYAMWRIAYADSVLHHYEEHTIRRVSDMLHVPHREFIRLKHLAQKT